MTETLGAATRATSETTDRAKDATKSNPLTDLAHSEAADHLKAEAQEYLAAQVQRLLVGAGRKLGETTGKLNDIADGNSPGFAKLALDSGRKLAEGKGPLRTALEVGAGRAKDSVVGGFKNLFGGKGKGKRKGGSGSKPTVILESIDVGVPARTAYDQWTQYQSFSTFAKGVTSANRADDTHSDWQLKVFWSNRSWKAHTTEQVPDERITWTSEGAKGTTKGVVSFHSLADDLTRVLLIIEYYPTGLFEKTGNIWRAQGRRARLDLKHFARFISLRGEAEDDAWRGEIRDGEVVVSHEDALEEEEQEEQRDDEAPEDDEAEAEYDEDEPEPDEEARDSDEPDGADATDENDENDEEDEEDEGEAEEVPEGEYEDVPEAEGDAGEDIDEEPYEDEDEERATVGGSRRR